MRVEYKFFINGSEVVISEECPGDTDVFRFLSRMQELYSNTICDKNGQTSNKVFFTVREAKDKKGKQIEYFELTCKDIKNKECHYAKRSFGRSSDDATKLFPKNKDKQGNWNPWVKYTGDGDVGDEE